MKPNNYNRVALRGEAAREKTDPMRPATVHALLTDRIVDTTVCGQLFARDTTEMPADRMVTCIACNITLQGIAEIDHAQRVAYMRQFTRQLPRIVADFEQSLVAGMKRCADQLRKEGEADLAEEMDAAALRLETHITRNLNEPEPE